MFRHLFDPILELFCIPETEKSYILFFYMNGIMGIVTEWLRKDCAESVEAITSLIMKYTLPTGSGIMPVCKIYKSVSEGETYE